MKNLSISQINILMALYLGEGCILIHPTHLQLHTVEHSYRVDAHAVEGLVARGLLVNLAGGTYGLTFMGADMAVQVADAVQSGTLQN